MKLVRFGEITEQAYNDYIGEWISAGETIVPWATSRVYGELCSLMHYWENDDVEEIKKKGLVPATLFFMLDSDDRIIGAVHFRHELDDRQNEQGGHIGYGIRPSERYKGYGKVMLALMLKEAEEHGYTEVMISCDKENIASQHVIEANGGFSEALDILGEKELRRYWIPLSGREN